MKPRDVFDVAIRAFGLWFIAQGAYQGYFGLLKVVGVSMRSAATPLEDLLVGGYNVIVGIIFLFAAGPLSLVLYRSAASDAPCRSQQDAVFLNSPTKRFAAGLTWLRYFGAIILVTGIINAGFYAYGRMYLGHSPDPEAFTALSSWIIIGLFAEVVHFCLSEISRKTLG